MKTFDISNLDDLPHKIYNFKSTTLGCKEKGIRNQSIWQRLNSFISILKDLVTKDWNTRERI